MTSESPSRALVVEDDAPTRAALARLLEAMGFIVATAGSLAAARRKLDGQAVILLDLTLPDGDGEQLLRTLSSAKHPAKVAVISATLDRCASVPKPWAYPPAVSFTKPLDVDALLAWMRAESLCGAGIG